MYSRQELIKMYENLVFARLYEQKVVDLFGSGKLPGFYHLSIGQEAVQIGVLNALGENDWIAPHPRCHPLYALKAGPRDFTAEMIGKPAGCCGGMASYPHFYAPELRVCPANGVLGNVPSIALGFAKGLKLDKSDAVLVIGLGDGEINQGVVSECFNLAKIYDLPVCYYIENNHLAISTVWEEVNSIPNPTERGKGFGIPGGVYDGNDVVLVRETMEEAIARARKGEITINTYNVTRWRGHFEGDRHDLYRDMKQVEFAMKYEDPIKIYEKYLLKYNILDEVEFARVHKEQQAIIDDAYEYALALPEATAEYVIDPNKVYA